MFASKEEQARLRLMSHHLNKRRERMLRGSPHVSFVQAFWWAYPVLFLYAWSGILW